jgi:3-deoxy-D-manno-octulosonic-acid transferase
VKHLLARALYSAVMRALLPLALLRLWWRGRAEPLYRHAWAQRLGLYGPGQRCPQAGSIWIHAVSLGETHAAAALIEALRAAQPDVHLLLTHGTATGWAAGQALSNQQGDAQTWLPLDTPGCVRRFLRHFQPAVGVLMETEVWPNLVLGAREQGVPMVLANARLSEQSQRQGQRLAMLFHPVMAAFSAVLAQSHADAQRLRAQGAARVQVCGHLKFDVRVNETLLKQGQGLREQLNQPVVMFAASREGEEAPLLDAWAGSAAQAAGMRLLIVPRHPQRFDEVEALIQARGWRLSRRSTWVETDWASLTDQHEADVWLGDSLGEMPLYYGLSQVALLGGSFAPLGGQNLIEAAACACPVIMGQHTFNFMQAAQWSEAAGAACRVTDLHAAVQQAYDWIQTGTIEDARQRASRFLEPHRGAAGVMAKVILELGRSENGPLSEVSSSRFAGP